VLEALDRRWEDAKRQLGPGFARLEVPKTLKEAMRNPLSFDRALERGELREEDLWQR
jgi:hypothetical protein